MIRCTIGMAPHSQSGKMTPAAMAAKTPLLFDCGSHFFTEPAGRKTSTSPEIIAPSSRKGAPSRTMAKNESATSGQEMPSSDGGPLVGRSNAAKNTELIYLLM
jgi:hypothetical protein